MKINKTEIQSMVLDRAKDLITKRGLRGWNMADLARESGLAKNTLYKIVGSKEQLVENVVMTQMKTTYSYIIGVMEEEGDYIPAMTRLTENSPEFLVVNRRVILKDIFLEYPAIETKAAAYQAEALKTIADFMRKGMNEGLIRNDVEPEFLIDLVSGVIDHYTGSGQPDELVKKSMSTAFKILTEGVRIKERWQ